MRTRPILAPAALAALVLASRAVFAIGTSPKPETPPASGPNLPPGSNASAAAASSGARQEAERSYALAYEEIGKAGKDAGDGKAKNAEKKYRKALGRLENIVVLDPNYHEAWNMLGYAARKVGDYDKAFAAYDRCLAIQPEFAPAREYLGEAWLEKGDLGKAQAQLAILEEMNPASEESKALRAALAAFVAVHPAAPADSSGTPADSTKTGMK